jgi:hypothetical protein
LLRWFKRLFSILLNRFDIAQLALQSESGYGSASVNNPQQVNLEEQRRKRADSDGNMRTEVLPQRDF